MAKFISEGKSIAYTASADLTAGSVVVIGSRIGVTSFDVKNGDDTTVFLEGIYEFPKASATTFSLGDKAYWDSTNSVACTDNTETLMGFVIKAVGAGTEIVHVRI